MHLLQLALPIALICWLAFAPARGGARVIHAAMTTTLVLAIMLYVPWLWPSAYVPIGLIAVLVLAILFGRRRAVGRHGHRLWPGLLAGVVTIGAAFVAGWLVTARLRPAVMFDLGLPFATAIVITEGGAHEIINAHRAVANPDSPSLSGWQGMADGISLQPVDHLGRIIPPPQPVLAPCAGPVVRQGVDTRLGTYVMLQCADQHVVLAGLATADVRGAVTQGQPVGTASTLTLHAQLPGTAAHPFSGAPTAISLNGTYPVRAWVLRP